MTRRHRGFTILEALASLAILGAAIFVASGVSVRRRAIERRVDERVAALRVVSSRMDDALSRGGWRPGRTEFTAPGQALEDARGVVTVEPLGPGLARLRVELAWGHDGSAAAVVRETVVEMGP